MFFTRRSVLAALGTMPLLAVGLAGAGSASSKNVIDVQIWDKGVQATMSMDMGIGGTAPKEAATMGLKLSTTTAKAGKVTFNVVNTSKDTVHEMVVLRYKDGEKLPYSPNDMKLNEDAAGHLGEVSELEPGKSGSVTLGLKPGKYLVACNIPGHYMNGMWEVVTVK